MTLRLSDEQSAVLGGLDPELKVAAEAIGVGLRPQLTQLAPALSKALESGDAGEPDATLQSLDLDHEGDADALCLAACVAAHRSYVTGRGRPGGTSTGALAIARILVWAHRAAMLGRPPTIAWIGPAPRLPEAGPDQAVLRARCTVSIGGVTRRAEAAAIISAPTAAGTD